MYQSYLKSSASVAVWSSESWITETALIQTVSVPPAVTVTRWPDVKVLHSPLNV